MPFMATKVSIDKAGRLVLPKPIRDKLHLEAGDDLLVETDGEQIRLLPVRPQPLFGRKDGIWVYLGPGGEDIDIVDLIDREREKRAKEFLE
jgi:AbrB family looped-hinge helix DNA binding protein